MSNELTAMTGGGAFTQLLIALASSTGVLLPPECANLEPLSDIRAR